MPNHYRFYSRGGIPIVRLIVILIWLCVPSIVPATETADGDRGSHAKLQGNRFLILTPDIHVGHRMDGILKELYDARSTIKSPSDYLSLIDEEIHDAFVYLGINYDKIPTQQFFEDMEKTEKPVLWISYHGWLLDKQVLLSKGIDIHDTHDLTYDSIEFDDRYELTPTDSTLINSNADKVIYWLISPSATRIPGAASSGNFTFVGYSPVLDVFAEDFSPFLSAIKIAFGTDKAPKTNRPGNYEKRIADSKIDPFRAGVHLPVYISKSSQDIPGYDHDSLHENLIRIKQSGAEWVNLVRTFFQENTRSSEVIADQKTTPTLEALKNIIGDAHALGLQVQIVLMLNLRNAGPNEWHGLIRPGDIDRWWESYNTLVLEMARFSRNNEVEALIIGNEYTSLQGQELRWRNLIRLVRKEAKYSGLLGYSVNYNAKEIEWADNLDFVGVSAYWPLSEDRDPDIATLMQSWQRVNEELGDWLTTLNAKRVEFTEAGYASQPYASVLPFSWKPHRGKAQSLSEQLVSYQSLYNYLKSQPLIKGVHVFASTSEDTDPNSIGYTPFGKPAEAVVEQLMRLR